MNLDKSPSKLRIDKLRKEITEQRYRYHVENDPSTTDAVYESLTQELVALERKYPEFAAPDSPTQRVGGAALDKFKKVPHSLPMLSLNNVFSDDELHAWDARVKKILGASSDVEYFCELKFDGLSISLEYEERRARAGINARRRRGRRRRHRQRAHDFFRAAGRARKAQL